MDTQNISVKVALIPERPPSLQPQYQTGKSIPADNTIVATFSFQKASDENSNQSHTNNFRESHNFPLAINFLIHYTIL